MNTSISNQLKSRFKAIEYMVHWEGGVNSSRLSRIFGVQANVIRTAINQYVKQHPDTLIFNGKDPEKLYIATSLFTPLYIPHNWESYVSYMFANSNEHIRQTYGDGAVSEQITPICSPQPEVTRILLKAIRLKSRVSVFYSSRNNPMGIQRVIAPHALSHDGLRWHCRAYCYKREQFTDFNLGRMKDLSIAGKADKHQHQDEHWIQFVEIKVAAHPALPPEEQALVLSDYGKKGHFVIRTRAALADYTIQFYRLGMDPNTCSQQGHPLVITNLEEIAFCLFRGPKG
ncbi:WYL domain-containing protein [Shewanella sp. SG41-4]|uniref:WYL domain-containing protein n=1 Tax=Shewanella sp. SG41-4 TaxID=2760976 RepID=UPI00160092A7|nr:WYL domain-containing protein [Shewanella sp. SG41-4]MBB1440668.1 WYL domain-containing protein [Shewanella sp. SG41-4]